LKSLGSERQIKKVVFYVLDQKPFRTNGIELHYSNGKSSFLGKSKSGYPWETKLTKEVKHIEVWRGEKLKGPYQGNYFYDECDRQISYGFFCTKIYKGTERIKKTIPLGFDLVGVTASID
jgi:hypothetical protein